MADIFRGFSQRELDVLWQLLLKLYQFDGIKMDGFEEQTQISDTYTEEELREGLERFEKRRRG